MGEKLPLAATSVATFISGLCIGMYKSWQLTLILLTVSPCIGITAGIMNVVGGRFQTRIQALYSQSGTIAEESISAARTVTAFNAQARVSNMYNVSLAGARAEGIKKFMVTGLGLGFFTFFIYSSYSLCFYFGAGLLENGKITTGDVVNVFFAILIGSFALGSIAPDLQAFSFGIGAGTKVFATIDRVPSIDPYAHFEPRNENESNPNTTFLLDPKKVEGRIQATDLQFTYPSRPDVPILKKIGFSIEPGQTVALVGQSGSGKSTIIQLLERFYDIGGGSLTIDGVAVDQINVHSLRRCIGLVSQEPVLFEGSVAENVAQGIILSS
jgi:ABC-type multidrug transport system fused ATPase/permease subunit